jgi:hypothetical protein
MGDASRQPLAWLCAGQGSRGGEATQCVPTPHGWGPGRCRGARQAHHVSPPPPPPWVSLHPYVTCWAPRVLRGPTPTPTPALDGPVHAPALTPRYFALCATKHAGVKADDINFHSHVPFTCLLYTLQQAFVANRVALLQGWLVEAGAHLRSLLALLTALPGAVLQSRDLGGAEGSPGTARASGAGCAVGDGGGSGSRGISKAGGASGDGGHSTELGRLLEDITRKERIDMVHKELMRSSVTLQGRVRSVLRAGVEGLPWGTAAPGTPCTSTPMRKMQSLADNPIRSESLLYVCVCHACFGVCVPGLLFGSPPHARPHATALLLIDVCTFFSFYCLPPPYYYSSMLSGSSCAHWCKITSTW